MLEPTAVPPSAVTRSVVIAIAEATPSLPSESHTRWYGLGRSGESS